MAYIGNVTYANSFTLKEILQDLLPELTLNDPVFTEIMPVQSYDTDKVEWDIRDNFKGLTGGRAPGGPYMTVKREGKNRYEVRPGYYGDQKILEEEFITKAGQIGTAGPGINVAKEQGSDLNHLLTRAIRRLKQVAWTFCTTGKYTCLDAQGTLIVSDVASLTNFNTAVAWSTIATATPLADIRKAKLRHRGHSVSFGRDAKLYLNSDDVNSLLNNTNQNDIGAKRFIQIAPGRSTTQPLTLADVNTYLASSDLPQIVEWDDFYVDDAGVTQLYITQGSGVLVGKRLNGDPVSEFMLTRNAELVVAGMQKTGPLDALANLFIDFEWKHKPLRGITTMGMNGAPAIYYPSAVVPFKC